MIPYGSDCLHARTRGNTTYTPIVASPYANGDYINTDVRRPTPTHTSTPTPTAIPDTVRRTLTAVTFEHSDGYPDRHSHARIHRS